MQGLAPAHFFANGTLVRKQPGLIADIDQPSYFED